MASSWPRARLRHSYPHSWRSKAPVIFRATPQWFVAIDKPISNGTARRLRELALTAIGETKWYPPRGAEPHRLRMVEERPDWVLSRQRAWGVPLAIFVDKKTRRSAERSGRVQAASSEAFEAEGADAWFTSPPSRFLGDGRNPDDYEQVTDILDVWFDSGSTHVFVVEHPIEPNWPQSRSRRSLSGRLRPASRLVSVVAAGKRGHARARALSTVS